MALVLLIADAKVRQKTEPRLRTVVYLLVAKKAILAVTGVTAVESKKQAGHCQAIPAGLAHHKVVTPEKPVKQLRRTVEEVAAVSMAKEVEKALLGLSLTEEKDYREEKGDEEEGRAEMIRAADRGRLEVEGNKHSAVHCWGLGLSARLHV